MPAHGLQSGLATKASQITSRDEGTELCALQLMTRGGSELELQEKSGVSAGQTARVVDRIRDASTETQPVARSGCGLRDEFRAEQ